MKPVMQAWIFVLAAAINSCIGNLLLKKSRLAAASPGLVSLLFSPWLIAGLCFYAVNVVLFAKALDHLPVSVAYPVMAAAGFALLTFTAGWFFQEQLSWRQWSGLATIIVGIYLLARA